MLTCRAGIQGEKKNGKSKDRSKKEKGEVDSGTERREIHESHTRRKTVNKSSEKVIDRRKHRKVGERPQEHGLKKEGAKLIGEKRGTGRIGKRSSPEVRGIPERVMNKKQKR